MNFGCGLMRYTVDSSRGCGVGADCDFLVLAACTVNKYGQNVLIMFVCVMLLVFELTFGRNCCYNKEEGCVGLARNPGNNFFMEELLTEKKIFIEGDPTLE